MIEAFTRARAALFAIAMLGAASAQAADVTVKIDNFTFSPESTEVAVGTTVTWLNEDDIPHAIATNERQFKSHALDTGDSFSFTFTQAGSYDYFCSLHPHMKGKIIVK
jgi:plastocyanin